MILQRYSTLYYIAIDEWYICLHSRLITEQDPAILLSTCWMPKLCKFDNRRFVMIIK
jgi:hypothetical protein